MEDALLHIQNLVKLSEAQVPIPKANILKKDRKFLLDPDNYIHIGVGCDGCGLFPIKGRRYNCENCPEGIGFDLCIKCYNSGVSTSGAFHQKHKPNHTMKEQLPVFTPYHALQFIHPELTENQLLQLIQLHNETIENEELHNNNNDETTGHT